MMPRSGRASALTVLWTWRSVAYHWDVVAASAVAGPGKPGIGLGSRPAPISAQSATTRSTRGADVGKLVTNRSVEVFGGAATDELGAAFDPPGRDEIERAAAHRAGQGYVNGVTRSNEAGGVRSSAVTPGSP